jgi:hypothetical protein
MIEPLLRDFDHLRLRSVATHQPMTVIGLDTILGRTVKIVQFLV